MNFLEQLATFVGIQDAVPTTDGKEQAVSDETRRALLRSIGIQASDEPEAEASLRALEDASWSRAIPPVFVHDSRQESIRVPVILDEGTVEFGWTLTMEEGEVLTGKTDFRDQELLSSRVVKGRCLESRCFAPVGEIPDGYHDLQIDGLPEKCRLIVTPGRCWLPDVKAQTKTRMWGIAAQVYLLRSQQNWGIGDYSDLSRLVSLAKNEGAAIVSVNPLHAMFLDRPGDASPYSPSDRLLLNVLNIDITELPELEHCDEAQALMASDSFQNRLQRCQDASLVDYDEAAALKMPILQLLFEEFGREKHSDWHHDFKHFHEERAVMLDRSCRFQALRSYIAETDESFAESQQLPELYASARASGVEEFARQQSHRVRFQLWLQWTADRQLRKVRDAAAGMEVGLYRDLAVGSHASGAEAWSRPELFAQGVRIGAPPDQFNPAGQNWGLPPLDPLAFSHDAYSSFVDLLRVNMRYAGALRIDHVMALRRLYWIPQGGETKDGAYVFYPIEDLIGIIALESHRNRCLVIGEDLGGVPDGFRERMSEANILSYRVLAFERGEDAFHAPDQYPSLALSVAGNHDLPTLSGWWSGEDIDLREKLQLFPSHDGAQQARDMRLRDREAIRTALVREGLIDGSVEIESLAFCQAAHDFLARTKSMLVIVQLDDLALEPQQVNVPGTSTEHPNWRRKLSLSLEDFESRNVFNKLASRMQSLSERTHLSPETTGRGESVANHAA